MKKSSLIPVIPHTIGVTGRYCDCVLFNANLLMNNCIW
jgi:hypothetical protein